MKRGLAFLGLLLTVACGASLTTVPRLKTPDASAPLATATATATVPTAPPTTRGTEATASAGETAGVPPALDEAVVKQIEERLRRHFAQYQGASSFAFFALDFAPRVERYLGLKDVAAKELVRVAREFYAAKTQVSLVPKAGSVTVSHENGRVVAAFVLTMRWSVKPPAAAAACGYLDDSMRWHPHSLIKRQVDVRARIGFDDAARIVTYEEVSVATPRLRVTNRGDDLQGFASLPSQPARGIEADPDAVRVSNNTVVADLGETFTCGLDQTEVDTVHKVRLNGHAMWLLADWTYDTGHNFVGETLLAPVH